MPSIVQTLSGDSTLLIGNVSVNFSMCFCIGPQQTGDLSWVHSVSRPMVAGMGSLPTLPICNNERRFVKYQKFDEIHIRFRVHMHSSCKIVPCS